VMSGSSGAQLGGLLHDGHDIQGICDLGPWKGGKDE